MNDLVNRIAMGQATLLGIEDICQRLSISRATFDRWVKNGSQQEERKARGGVLGQLGAGPIGVGSGRRVASLFAQDEGGDSSMSFPPPDIRIGNSPKWEMETFKRWLQANVRPGA